MGKICDILREAKAKKDQDPLAADEIEWENIVMSEQTNGTGARCEDRLECQDDALSALVLSTLPKTWIFDLDGTILKHNGYKIDGHDTMLPGVREYLNLIPEDDHILILTSRTDEFREMTLFFLQENGIRYDEILFNIPMGERIVVNDRKPSGIDMAVAINIDRDKAVFPAIRREK